MNDASTIVEEASKLTGESDGYTFAIIVMSVLLIIAAVVIRELYNENKDLQTKAVSRAESQTKALTEALNAVKENYRNVTELLIEIKSNLK